MSPEEQEAFEYETQRWYETQQGSSTPYYQTGTGTVVTPLENGGAVVETPGDSTTMKVLKGAGKVALGAFLLT
jgi:hypothetical protein